MLQERKARHNKTKPGGFFFFFLSLIFKNPGSDSAISKGFLSPQKKNLKTLEFYYDGDDKVELIFIGHSVYAQEYYLHVTCITLFSLAKILHRKFCFTRHFTDAAIEFTNFQVPQPQASRVIIDQHVNTLVCILDLDTLAFVI